MSITQYNYFPLPSGPPYLVLYTCNLPLIQVAKDTSVSKTIVKLKTRYLERDGWFCQWMMCVSIHIFCFLHTDSSNKSGIAHTFHAMALHSPDSAKKVASEILPLIFLAMHAKAKEDGTYIHKF